MPLTIGARAQPHPGETNPGGGQNIPTSGDVYPLQCPGSLHRCRARAQHQVADRSAIGTNVRAVLGHCSILLLAGTTGKRDPTNPLLADITTQVTITPSAKRGP